MRWHIQTGPIIARLLPDQASIEAMDAYAGVVTFGHMGSSRIFAFGAHRDGSPISPQEWRALVRDLRDQCGITEIYSERLPGSLTIFKASRDRPD